MREQRVIGYLATYIYIHKHPFLSESPNVEVLTLSPESGLGVHCEVGLYFV